MSSRMRSLLCALLTSIVRPTPSDECDTTLAEAMSSTHGFKDFSSIWIFALTFGIVLFKQRRGSRWSDLSMLRRSSATNYDQRFLSCAMSLWNTCTNLASMSSWMSRDTVSGSSSADFQFVS